MAQNIIALRALVPHQWPKECIFIHIGRWLFSVNELKVKEHY